MTSLLLPVERQAGTPLHRQVYDGLRRAILDGRVRPGQRLPSTRGLAQELGVSRLPVLAAYEQLVHEGYLVGRPGSGTYVSQALPDDRPRSSSPVRFGRRAEQGSSGTAAAAPRSRMQGLGPFRVGLPALDRFPRASWARLIARQARALTPARLAYGDPAGVAGLRNALAEHLRAARAVRCEPDQIMVVSGSQAALRLAASVLLDPGDRVAVEEPGYFGAHAAFRAAGAELVPIPVDEEGLDVAALHRRAEVRVAFVTPSHQFPLGVSLSAARRLALLDWAHRAEGWVVEDDYDSEFRYVSRPIGSLQGMDGGERVLYVGTFSKALAPAVRIGYLVIPPPLWPRFLKARAAIDFFAPPLLQEALAEFIATGDFARHLRRMRGVYQERREALVAGLARNCSDTLQLDNADAGLHLTAMFRGPADDRDAVRRLRARGLAAMALSSSYIGPSRQSGLLLGFGGSSPRILLEATRVLGDVLRE